MSKYIPGNQKHLTLEDRIYIENELNKGTSFKDIARFLCKDPTTISKKSKLTVSLTGITKVLFITPRTSVSIGITARKQMPAARSSSAASNALPVLPAIRHAETLKRNAATAWTRLLMSATAVPKRSTTAPSRISILTMPGLLTANTVKSSGIPDPAST